MFLQSGENYVVIFFSFRQKTGALAGYKTTA
jgi:hypothetical protein